MSLLKVTYFKEKPFIQRIVDVATIAGGVMTVGLGAGPITMAAGVLAAAYALYNMTPMSESMSLKRAEAMLKKPGSHLAWMQKKTMVQTVGEFSRQFSGLHLAVNVASGFVGPVATGLMITGGVLLAAGFLGLRNSLNALVPLLREPETYSRPLDGMLEHIVIPKLKDERKLDGLESKNDFNTSVKPEEKKPDAPAHKPADRKPE